MIKLLFFLGGTFFGFLISCLMTASKIAIIQEDAYLYVKNIEDKYKKEENN